MTKMIDLSIQEKIYKGKKTNLSLLEDFKLEVNNGERIAVVGKSGVGKTTMLSILGLLDRDYTGSYELFGLKTNDMTLNQFAELRNQKIGFVLQESALIDSLTIEENIRLPLLYSKGNHKTEDLESIAAGIDIAHILNKKPLECSGGEKARAVFARAILMRPDLLLCDEPTASLDGENKERILSLICKMNQEFGTTIITVTHDREVADRHDRIIHLERKM